MLKVLKICILSKNMSDVCYNVKIPVSSYVVNTKSVLLLSTVKEHRPLFITISKNNME